MYIPLRNFTKFTISDSILDIKDWLKKVAESKIPAVACTDKANMFGLVQFYQTALKVGVKPLIGVHFELSVLGVKKSLDCLFLALNNQGYIDLSSIISDYYQKISKDQPLPLSLVSNRSSNICIIIQQNSIEELATALPLIKPFFEHRLFIGLERYADHRESFQKSQDALIFCQTHQIPPIIANSVFFLNEDDYETQQIKVCIQESDYLDNQKRVIHHHKDQHFYTPEKINELFSDCPIALENSLLLGQRCTVDITFGNTLLPQFSENEKKTLEDLSTEGLIERANSNHKIGSNLELYKERLNIELSVITQMGFSGYFLIVSDFIRWAKKNDIPVGPGRGSGAGSLVAYCLKITDLDPLEYDLLFERFLNPERVSMPDFDVDFCMDRRDDVIRYVQERYGLESVSQIATFGTMAAKAVIRDVGRVLHHPFPFVDKIAKMIPNQLGITLQEALEKGDELKKAYAEDEVVTQLIDYALKLEGLPRNIGKHAGGVVIAPRPLKTICPLYNEPDAPWHPVTQLDKDDVESIGLIKFDFLGLKTLTVIDWTYKNAEKIGQNLIPLDKLPLDDKKSFTMLLEGKTIAVFQLESRGMRDLILRLKPDCFEDIIALVALFRPGPLQSGMVDDFIDRKHGRASTLYPHPLTEPILKPTYGVILYQEQVMQIAQVLAGYTLGGADLLRRAMGKKKPEEMAQQREIFVKGATEKGIDTDISSYIFDLMEKFAGYGFNKSHSAAYALIAFQTLYLKRHAAAAFMAANMTAEQGNLEKTVVLINDARSLGLTVHAPSIAFSEIEFHPIDDKNISFGLGSIKGLGVGVLEPILQQRNKYGAYRSFEDFISRVSFFDIPKKSIELMIKAGVFDSLDPNRRDLLEQQLPHLLSKYASSNRAQLSLFDESDFQEKQILDDFIWSQKIKLESELLGLSMSGTLLDPFYSIKQTLWDNKYRTGVDHKLPILVTVSNIKDIVTTSLAKIFIAQFSFQDGHVEVVLNAGKERDQEKIAKILHFYEMQKPAFVFIKAIEGKNKKIHITLNDIIDINSYFSENLTKLILKSSAHIEDPSIYKFFKNLENSCQKEKCEVHLYDEHKNLMKFIYTNPGEQTESYLQLIEKVFSYRKFIGLEIK